MNASRTARRAPRTVPSALPEHTCTPGVHESKLACPRCKAARDAFQGLGDPAADEGVRPVALAAPVSGVRVIGPAPAGEAIPVVREHTCLTTGSTERCGRCQQFGAVAPAWATRPAAVHANARRLTPAALPPSELDPGELPSSLIGRVLRPFGEV